MTDNKEFLGTEPIKKWLFKLAVPTVVAQLVNMLYNIIDRVYIGHMPEDSALALTGIGVCMPLILVVAAFAALVSSGGAPQASIHMGKKDYKTAEHILGNCLSLLKYGGDIAVGAMTICTSTMQFAMLAIQGIGQGSQPIASYNYGAKNAGRVKETFSLLLKICMTYSVILWIAIMVFPDMFSRIFTGDSMLIEYASTALRIYCAGMFLFGIQIACQLTFTSIGNAPCSIIVAVIRKFILLIPLIYIVPGIGILENQALDVYLAEPIADVIAVTFTSILFYFQFRKALQSLEMPL